jgi:Holliday junction resolvasome RuvABC endonuclease subunit
MRFLFCDQSIDKFGYSIFEDNGEQFQLMKYGIIKLNTKLDYFDRILTLETILDSLIEKHNITQVVIEDIQYQSNVATYKKLSALQFFLQYYFLNRKIECEKPVQVNVWRNFVNRKHFSLEKGDKSSLFRHLNSALNQPKGFKTDHTDAIGIGIWYGKTKVNKMEIILTNSEMEEINATKILKEGDINGDNETIPKSKSKRTTNSNGKKNKKRTATN